MFLLVGRTFYVVGVACVDWSNSQVGAVASDSNVVPSVQEMCHTDDPSILCQVNRFFTGSNKVKR